MTINPQQHKLYYRISKIISTFFYSGLLKPASGTFGTFFGILFFIVFNCNSITALQEILCCFVLLILGVISIKYYTTNLNNKDPKEVVIDEVLGIFISIFISKFILHKINASLIFTKPIIILGLSEIDKYFLDVNKHYIFISLFYLLNFIFFRIFDIFKPFPCNYFDKIKNSFGVMIDDLIAGIYSGIISASVILTLYFYN